MKEPHAFTVVILGDASVDTIIVPLSRAGTKPPVPWHTQDNSWSYRRGGGVWLLKDIMDAAFDQLKKSHKVTVEVLTYDLPQQLGGTVQDKKTGKEIVIDRDLLNSSVVLDLFPQDPGKKKQTGKEDKTKVYRAEVHLGWIHNAIDPYTDEVKTCHRTSASSYLTALTNGRSPCDLLVLHDTNSYFRRLDESTLEPALTRLIGPETWIVWQMYGPFGDNSANTLWSIFQKHASSDAGSWLDRTVAIVKGEDLRQAGANLSSEISLEKESENFLDSINDVEPLRDVATRVRHLVVHLHHEGAIHYDREKGLEASCYFCPNLWHEADPHKYGFMAGYTSITVTTIAKGILWSKYVADPKQHPHERGIISGVRQGVVLDHRYFKQGYLSKDGLTKKPGIPNPYPDLFADLLQAEAAEWGGDWKIYGIAATPLPVDGRKDRAKLANWTRIPEFLRESLPDGKKLQQQALLEKAKEVALNIVLYGLDKTTTRTVEPSDIRMPGTPPHTRLCPYETHGKIQTAYRQEVDNFASIRRIMKKYLEDDAWKAPLSLAVLGPPGSGKSFTIKQILENVDPTIARFPLEYNVAQFDKVDDLATAFHKAQDRALANEVPLVFFDEFDATLGEDRLAWLKYFLAPMQDGKFKAGESTYRIGRAIFVFAGGIHHNWTKFYDEQKDDEEFVKAKGPDFVSRLRGYLNIESINVNSEGKRKDAHKKQVVDPVLMFRRAVILRSLLENHLKDIIDKSSEVARIAPRIVHAFLKIPNYEHGVRSMQAIIEMSQVSQRDEFQRASLPARDQLNMHVNATKFLRMVDGLE